MTRLSPVRRPQALNTSVRHWRVFLRDRKGTAGSFLLLLFLVVALLAPLITFNDPITQLDLAESMAPPEWLAVLPGFEDLPRNTAYLIMPHRWQTDATTTAVTLAANPRSLIAVFPASSLERHALLTYTFDYGYRAPKTFTLSFRTNVTVEAAQPAAVRLSVVLTRLDGDKVFLLFDRVLTSPFHGELTAYSRDQAILRGNKLAWFDNLAEHIFSRPGRYVVALGLQVRGSDVSAVTVALSPALLQVKSRLYGLLGTNYLGQDVWAQFVWGTRASLTVAGIVGAIAMVLGTLVGLVAGYKGGLVDRILVSLADTAFLMPLLPVVLLVMVIMREINMYAIASVIGLIVWTGLARQLRAWVLSLRERPFVEAARAVGCSNTRIMLRYILPHTTPFLTYWFVILLPGAIILEAALHILGFGDPLTPSWGKIVAEAWHGSAIIYGAWWWILPPIAGIVFLALAFVLIGFALDEVLNPRLRAR